MYQLKNTAGRMLIDEHPELGGRTLWKFMTEVEVRLVWGVVLHEQEFGRPLPNSSFYKSMALDACKRAIARFRQDRLEPMEVI